MPRYFCSKCGDKLESFEVMQRVTSWHLRRMDWDMKVLCYCDNQECESVGIVLALALRERPDLADQETGDD